MNSFQSWLSIAANIGIVAGLVLVAFQINQESEIAGTTIEGEVLSNSIDYYETLVGEDAPSSMARALYEPRSLSETDKVVLFHLYLGEFVKLQRVERLMNSEGAPSQGTVARWVLGLLSNSYGIAWFQQMRDQLFAPFTPKHLEAIDAFISQRDGVVPQQRENFDAIDAYMAQAGVQRVGSP